MTDICLDTDWWAKLSLSLESQLVMWSCLAIKRLHVSRIVKHEHHLFPGWCCCPVVNGSDEWEDKLPYSFFPCAGGQPTALTRNDQEQSTDSRIPDFWSWIHTQSLHRMPGLHSTQALQVALPGIWWLSWPGCYNNDRSHPQDIGLEGTPRCSCCYLSFYCRNKTALQTTTASRQNSAMSALWVFSV